jgi:AbrB family looped-hinge helix DNA binding protein
MPTRITVSGRITLPREVRAALRLSPGDEVEFTVNVAGEIVLSKRTTQPVQARPAHARVAAQTRRRAAELLALLRGLD